MYWTRLSGPGVPAHLPPFDGQDSPADERLLSAVAAGGADFVFLGGPGSELIPPAYYEEFLIPYSQTLSAMAHAQGLLIYSHICSPFEPMLSLGYTIRWASTSLKRSPNRRWARQEPGGRLFQLDSAICTRGNLGLDLLLTASPAEILDRSTRSWRQRSGWAASISWPPATISSTSRQQKTSTPCAKLSVASTACNAQNNPGAARSQGSGLRRELFHWKAARRIDWSAAAHALPLQWEIRRGRIVK